MTIEYTDLSWNPIVGCKSCSIGCINCYAARDAGTRLSNTPDYKGLAVKGRDAFRFTGEVRYRMKDMELPFRKTKPNRYFVCSTSDIFYEKVDRQILDTMFATMLLTPWNTYMLLTKRVVAALDYLTHPETYERVLGMANMIRMSRPGLGSIGIDNLTKMLPSWIWFGVSVENQENASRLRLLRSIPAMRRWVSFAPLLSRVEFGNLEASVIDWAVFEGESGDGARPCDVVDIRHMLRLCREYRIPAYVKQLGSLPYNGYDPLCHGGPDCDCERLHFNSPSGHDPEEWPEDLRVQQFPPHFAVREGLFANDRIATYCKKKRAR